jgi:hypothetical protein
MGGSFFFRSIVCAGIYAVSGRMKAGIRCVALVLVLHYVHAYLSRQGTCLPYLPYLLFHSVLQEDQDVESSPVKT